MSFDDLENLFYRENTTVINFHMPKKEEWTNFILFIQWDTLEQFKKCGSRDKPQICKNKWKKLSCKSTQRMMTLCIL